MQYRLAPHILFATIAFLSAPFALCQENPCAKYDLYLPNEYDPETLPQALLANYTQTHYQPVDPLGDYALARTAMITPKQIFWVVAKRPDLLKAYTEARTEAESCAQALFETEGPQPPVYEANVPSFEPTQAQVQTIERLPVSPARKQLLMDKLNSGQLFLEGRKNPFNVKKMEKMLQEIIVEEAGNGITPSRSEAGTWSSEFLSRARLAYFPFTAMPKLLVALARGETDQYFRTDTQDALQDWILAQPRRAVTIDSIFRASYRLSHGDVYLALLTIENVLSRNWRATNREALAVSQRLADITNFFGREDNHFGSWYHLVGIMLYGLTSNGLEAWAIGFTERMGSHVMNHWVDSRQESYANLRGGALGAYLKRLVRSGSWQNARPNPQLCDPAVYLDLDEDFTSRLISVNPS